MKHLRPPSPKRQRRTVLDRIFFMFCATGSVSLKKNIKIKLCTTVICWIAATSRRLQIDDYWQSRVLLYTMNCVITATLINVSYTRVGSCMFVHGELQPFSLHTNAAFNDNESFLIGLAWVQSGSFFCGLCSRVQHRVVSCVFVYISVSYRALSCTAPCRTVCSRVQHRVVPCALVYSTVSYR